MDFEEEKKKINTLYNKAVTEKDYEEIVEKASDLQLEMIEENVDYMLEATLNGWWSYYYLVRKFRRTKESIKDLHDMISCFYSKATKAEVKISYGYLLSVILSELKGDVVEANRINAVLDKMARKSGGMVSMLRVINARGIGEMKEANFEEAVEVFDEIRQFKDIPEEAFRHAGNIINNRGASKIRGDINPIDGLMDLIVAAKEYYLKEKEVSLKHIEGIINRVNEAKDKLKNA